MTRSIVSNLRRCLICGATEPLHKHHVFMAANRTISEREGCWVYLCSRHHNGSNEGVHFDARFDRMLKMYTQARWMWINGRTVADFRKVFGKSYIDEEDFL